MLTLRLPAGNLVLVMLNIGEIHRISTSAKHGIIWYNWIYKMYIPHLSIYLIWVCLKMGYTPNLWPSNDTKTIIHKQILGYSISDKPTFQRNKSRQILNTWISDFRYLFFLGSS